MDPSRILYQLDPVTPTTYDEQSYRDLAQHTANWKFEYTHLGLEVDQTQWLLEQQTLNSFAGLENPPPSFNYNVFPAAQKVQSATPLSSAVPAKRRRLDVSHCQIRDQYDSNHQSPVAPSRKRLNKSHDQPFPFANISSNVPAPNFSEWIEGPQPFSMCTPAVEYMPTAQRANPSQRHLHTDNVEVYDPSEFCHKKAAESDSMAQYGVSSTTNTNYVAPMPQQLTSSLTATSPFSRSSGMTTDDETNPSSVSMSRQSSLVGSSFCGALDMFRIDSSVSNVNSNTGKTPDILSLATDQPVATPSNTNFSSSTTIDPQHYISHAGGVLNDTPLSSKLDHSMSPLILIDEHHWDMQRSTSAQSSLSNSSGVQRPNQDHATSSSRPIAPKAEVSAPMSKRSSSTSAPPMIRMQSSDGSYRDVVEISKTKYVRPKPVKVMCDRCNREPNGFRGAAELVRHQKTAHALWHKVWVCVQAPRDAPHGNISLSQCTHCMNKKQYRILHNAVAHLRRVHFNPRKPKGLEGGTRPREKRGGASGGTDPPSGLLERYWTRSYWKYEESNEKGTSKASPAPKDSNPQRQAPDDFPETPSVDFSIAPTMNPRLTNNANKLGKASSPPLLAFNEPRIISSNTSGEMQPQQELAVDTSMVLNEYSDASINNLIDTRITFDHSDPVLYDISQSDIPGLLDGCNDFPFSLSFP